MTFLPLIVLIKARAGLVPVKKMVHPTKGASFMRIYWITPEEARAWVKEGKAQYASHDIQQAKPSGKAKGTGREVEAIAQAIAMSPGRYYEQVMKMQDVLWPEKVERGTKNYEQILDTALSDFSHAMELESQGQDMGRGWYARRVDRARAILTKMHPELCDDTFWYTYVVCIAAQSPGNKPNANITMADEMYSSIHEYGYLPHVRPGGKQWGKTGKPLVEKFNKLIKEKGGVQGMTRYLLGNDLLGNVKKYGGGHTKGKAKDTVSAALCLGPKAGAFFGNLTGNHDSVTLDMWMMRAWHRWNGTLKVTTNSRGEPEIEVKNIPKSVREQYESVVYTLSKKWNMDPDDVQAVLWYYEGRLYNLIGVKEKAGSRDYAQAAKRLYQRYLQIDPKRLRAKAKRARIDRQTPDLFPDLGRTGRGGERPVSRQAVAGG